MGLGPYTQSTAVSKTAGVDQQVQKLADEIQADHMTRTGLPMDRNDAVSKAMRDNPELVQTYLKDSYGPSILK